jgi:hypothetical protein
MASASWIALAPGKTSMIAFSDRVAACAGAPAREHATRTAAVAASRRIVLSLQPSREVTGFLSERVEVRHSASRKGKIIESSQSPDR